MDLYGDLPPASQGDGGVSGEGWLKMSQPKPEAKKAVQVKALPTEKRSASAMFVQSSQVTAKTDIKTVVSEVGIASRPAVSLAFKPRQTISAAIKANNNQAADQLVVKTVVAKNQKENVIQTDFEMQSCNFEVEDPYEPSKPNDYLDWCHLREERKKRAKLEIENKKEMDERRREQEKLEAERAQAMATGDIGRIQATLGRGRGRGNVSNIPAWMKNMVDAPDFNSNSASEVSEKVVHQNSSKFELSGEDFAAKFMRDKGYEAGSGLGKNGTGISAPIEVVPVSGVHSRGIVVKQNANPVVNSPSYALSSVILVKNMVGPGELDYPGSKEQLQTEVVAECSKKYGSISRCVIFDISKSVPNIAEAESVLCFLQFEKHESAAHALSELNNRFFGGRQLSATYFEEDKFKRNELYQ